MNERAGGVKVGVETGGTFTDLVAVSADGMVVRKVPSVPRAPDEGVMNALAAAELDLERCDTLAHGSTVATNAILERKGARVALVTTRGFRDVLFLQRHDRSNIYDIKYAKPVPVIRREDCFEVDERILADGTVQKEMADAELVDRLIPRLREGRYQAVAVCFLNSYVNSAHEERAAELLRAALPEVPVTRSIDVSREFREYERSSTTSLSAYVQPVMDQYLGRLEQHLQRRGFGGGLSIMQSNGGRLPAVGIRRNAIAALFSGPAAGVVGALNQVARSGFSDIITLDVGGTSSDVCVVDAGQPMLTREFKIDGLPVRTPMIRIVTTGAGGGSIVRQDEGGMLRAGPQSAGADPGPACYGRGGRQPTVTDAHMIRGTIPPDVKLGGTMPLDIDAARTAFGPLAKAFATSLEEAADNAIRIADSNIVRAIEITSTELGKDPRDYALVAFGGGGPLHAARVADALGMTTVVIPANAGIISAYGLLVADFTLHDSATRRIRLDADAPAEIKRCLGEARQRLRDEFTAMRMTGPFSEIRTLEMRFRGQAYDIPVGVADLDGLTEDRLRADFLAAYRQVYYYVPSGDTPIEIMGVGMTMSQLSREDVALGAADMAAGTPSPGRVFENQRWHDTQLYRRGTFPVGIEMPGPIQIEDVTSTLFVPEGWSLRRDEHANLIMRKVEAS